MSKIQGFYSSMKDSYQTIIGSYFYMNYIVTIILIVLAGWLLWIWLSPADVTPDVDVQNGPTTTLDNSNATTTNGQNQNGLGTLRTFQSPTLLENATTSWTFTMQLPADTEVDVVSDAIIEFMYMGPDAEPNTELTDGYLMTIQLFPTSSIASYVGNADALGQVATRTIGSLTTRTYQTESELGTTVTHYVFPLSQNENATATAFADVAVTIAGNGQYEQSVQRSLQSLRFIQVEE